MRQAAQVAYWAAVGSAILVSVFGILVVIGFWRPVHMLSQVPIFLLGPVVVVLMSALHQLTPPERRVWSLVSLSFAIIYAVFATMVYYVQLTVVRLNDPPFTEEALRVIRLGPGTPAFALDMLCYTFLPLATWAQAAALPGGPETLWLRRLLTLHGVTAIPTVLVPAHPIGAFVAPGGAGEFYGKLTLLVWCAVFVPMAAALARHVRGRR